MSECTGITSEQLKTTNGCGSSAWYAWPIRIPKWFDHDFWWACNQHDLTYQNPKLTHLIFKRYADDRLVQAMYDNMMADHSIIKSHIKLLLAEFTYFALNTRLSEWCWYRAKRGKD